MRIACIVALVAVPLFWGAAQAQLLPFAHYTTESDPRALPSAEVHAVYQDQLGFVWAVVYSSGLVRYDGVRMELYTKDDGLRSLALWDVTEDAEGHLWASSNAGLVVSDRPLTEYGPGERVRFVRERDGVDLVDVTVRRNVMAAAADGRFWVGTDSPLGIIRYRWGRGRLIADTLDTSSAQAGGEQPVRSVLVRQDGSIWVGFRGGALIRFDETGDAEIISGSGAPQATVFVLYEDDSGSLWGGEFGGRLWRMRDAGGEYVFETISRLASSIHSIRSVGDDRLIASSEGSGVLVLDRDAPDRQQIYSRKNGLISDVIHQVRVDLEGNVWVAQSGGLSRLRPNYAAFQAFNARSQVGEQPTLPGPSVGAVAPVDAGSPCKLWAATSGAGVACVHAIGSGESTYVTSREGLLNDYTNAVLLDEQSRVWIGSHSGLDVVVPPGGEAPQGANTSVISVAGTPHRLASLAGTSVIAAAELALPVEEGSPDRVRTIWFASTQSAYVYAEGAWYGIGEAAGLPATFIHAVAADEAGYVWIGTRDRGLFRSNRPITLGTLEAVTGSGVFPNAPSLSGQLFEPVWTSSAGAPTDQIESLLWHDGVMWTATPVGLFALDFDEDAGAARAHVRFDQDSGLRAAPVYSMAISPITGSLWIGTNGGLSEIDPANMTVLRNLTRRHGLIDNEVWYYGSVRVDRAGRVYFGTAQGLSIYDPSLDEPAPPIESIHLRRANFLQERGRPNEATFEYAAAGFASEGSILYRTRLRNYESEWSEPTTDARIRYTNLPAVFRPRAYTFEVVASNIDGVWTENPLSYTFHVDPPWWLQWWMFIVYVGILGAGVVTVDRIQRRRLTNKLRAESQLREAEFRAESAAAEQEAAEARARALQAENERKEAELTKARELELAYNELKNTQNQLIHAEKMASLGQLTAGIAHEIKNPLNFVNNFSRASIELLAELREELEQLGEDARHEVIDQIVADLGTMAEKVAQHGDRADRIVKSMLQHSRGATGNFQEENLNSFVDEYVNLAYHGMRAQHSGFDVEVVRDFDEDAGVVQVMSQEFSRVIINLLNNAFYAVHQQKKVQGADYAPRVIVRTGRSATNVTLEVEDNGPGIPEEVRKRIFEPFFTTKPTGQGTGLGLSLSYEIITQMHGGHLKVQTVEGCGTTFTIELPVHTGARRSRATTELVEERGDGTGAGGPDVTASTSSTDRA